MMMDNLKSTRVEIMLIVKSFIADYLLRKMLKNYEFLKFSETVFGKA